MRRQKLALSLFFAAVLLLLCGCQQAEPVIATMPTALVQASTEPAPTEPATTPTELDPPVTVYAGAVEDYLLPLEDFSWERQYAPEFIMLHFSSAVVEHPEDPYNMDLIRAIYVDYGVSVHYILARDGTVYCYIPEDRVAWHAGPGEFAGDPKYTNTMNQYAIGIEIAAIGSETDMEGFLTSEEYAALDDSLIGYTQAQYAALRALITDLSARYDIPMDREHIIGHSDYTPGKYDPGELLDWSQILPESPTS